MDETAVGGHHATAGRIIRLIGLIRLIRACQASYGQKEDLLPWSQPVLEGICLLRSKQTCLLTVLAPYTGLLMHTHPVHAFAGFGHGDGRYGRSYMRRPMLPSWLIAVLLVLHTCSCARLDDAGVVAPSHPESHIDARGYCSTFLPTSRLGSCGIFREAQN
jgi:hypothetical protein